MKVATRSPEGELPPIPLAHRINLIVASTVPVLGLVVAIVMLWNRAVDTIDVLLLVGFLIASAHGITIGYHRMLTHRGFDAPEWVRAFFLILGNMAVQGRPLEWALDHRIHHACSDKDGDPHSPHAGFDAGIRGTLKGLAHAHVGWMWNHTNPHGWERWVPDLLADRTCMALSGRWYWPTTSLTLIAPAALGGLLHGSWEGALSGLVWGGLARLFLGYHLTFSVNSICHVFGSRPFGGRDYSTNNPIIGVLAMGEGWHHNHHVFPTSARHGLRWWQLDSSWIVIRTLRGLGVASNVRVASVEQQRRALERARRGEDPAEAPGLVPTFGTGREAHPRPSGD